MAIWAGNRGESFTTRDNRTREYVVPLSGTCLWVSRAGEATVTLLSGSLACNGTELTERGASHVLEISEKGIELVSGADNTAFVLIWN